MVKTGERICPNCGGELRGYDHVRRTIRLGDDEKRTDILLRLKCSECGKVHREIPDYIEPYKQYEKDTIEGFIEDDLDNTILGYEDYPCEMTIKRWKNGS